MMCSDQEKQALFVAPYKGHTYDFIRELVSFSAALLSKKL